MTIVNKIIALAKKEVGTKEKPKGSNNVKYNTAYYGREVYDGLWNTEFPWCCTFIWWLFKMVGASHLFYGGGKTASCTTLMNYYKKKGQFSKTPRVGSLVFFNWGKGSTAKHIGIIIKINANGSFVTIEGNTAVGNDSNGGEVMERNRTASQTLGFAYPYEDGTPTKGDVCNVELNVLKKGCKGESVKALQILLNGFGYNCGTADGDFGANTTKAVKQFQTKNKLSADGIVGANTWKALLT